MLIHNAYFWLKKDLTDEERTIFESELTVLADIPYLASGFVGKPARGPRRPLTDHTFDYATSLHFKTLVDHDYYHSGCSTHARFIEHCSGYWEKIVIHEIRRLNLEQPELRHR